MAEIAAAVAIISGAYSVYSGYEQKQAAKAAAAEQERLARENAANIEAEALEEKRRAQKAADAQQADSRARAAASGVSGESPSSIDIFLGAQEDEWQKQLEWITTSAANRADIARRSGYMDAAATRMAGKAAFAEGIQSGLGSFGSAYSYGGKANWW